MSRALYHASSLSMFKDALFSCSKRAHIGILKNIVAGLESSAPSGIDHIYNKAKLVSWFL